MATPAKQHDCRGKYLCKIIKENVQYLWVTSYSSGHDYYLTSPAEDEERPFEASQRGSLSSRLLKKHIKQSSQKKKALFYVFTLFAVYMSVSNCLYDDHHPLECNMKKKSWNKNAAFSPLPVWNWGFSNPLFFASTYESDNSKSWATTTTVTKWKRNVHWGYRSTCASCSSALGLIRAWVISILRRPSRPLFSALGLGLSLKSQVQMQFLKFFAF